ncbi:hypothetical protein Gohar_001400 [Gossypium harknessii]|uniref:Uncharacterized protein n=1 Tax=Gossypium harknessii TaxID=34285 RepID=A0A7J9I4L5_9ROSI|nr:hypothetical protein [Gossypium harknessii]
MQSGESLGGESGVARATKKVCRREDDPPNVGDMEVDEGRAKVVSFKDKLLGRGGSRGIWVLDGCFALRRNAKMETNQQKMNNGSRFSLIIDLNEESGDGTTGNMDGNSSSAINVIMPRLGFSLGEASGSSLSGSKNKGKALQGSGLRKKGLNGVKFGSSGPQQKSNQVKEPHEETSLHKIGTMVAFHKLGENKKIIEEKGNHKVVVVEENWDPNIMVVKGKNMSNKSGLKLLESEPSSSVPPEPYTVKWGKFRDQNHHGLRNKKKVDAMMLVVDLVENISEQIDSAIRNIEVPRENGMELLEAEGDEGNFQAKC